MSLILALLFFNGISGKIQGVIKNQDTGAPIPDVNVIILNTELGTASDENGNFFILNIPEGRYTLEVSCVGYQTKRIDGVVVEIDKTTHLDITLRETTISITPVIVRTERPFLKKDEVSTVYIVRKEEISYMPMDYTIGVVSFQPSVAHFDTSIHVRGGRATEVLYMIDNVSIIDPQTGDMAINLSKSVIEEVIFLPGSFDAEYGRAMSGVINMITERPLARFHPQVYAKTERMMPYYYDFGYENYQSSIHLPVTKWAKSYISFDLMRTDDWDPKLFILPHKERDDYSLYGKLLFTPTANLTVNLSGVKSRTQFDRYHTQWKFLLDNYRSDLRQGDLQAINVSYLPSQKSLITVTLSRLYTNRIFGIREDDSYNPLENFSFRDYTTLDWPSIGSTNPYGITYKYLYWEGDYPEYQDKSSHVLKANANTQLHIGNYYEIKAGVEYSYLDLKNFSYFVSDTTHQLIDEYQYFPEEVSVYLQNNLDYKVFCAKIGGRYDCFSADLDTIEGTGIFSPRLGFSCMVTPDVLIRINYGQYTQPPLYDHMYGYHSLLPFPSYVTDIPPIGNPELIPEKTRSYEFGIQSELHENLAATVNAYYKDVSDLVGTRFVPAQPTDYVSYFNVEYANIKGVETILEFYSSLFTGRISYTLSWAIGTSSYAEEVYYKYYKENPDTNFVLPATDYYLDFDQRHRIFVQGMFNIPWQTKLHLFAYLGSGFPYTPPGPEGEYQERNILQLPFQRQIDCVVSKSINIGNLSIDMQFEIINMLDARYEIAPLVPYIPKSEIHYWDFEDYVPFDSKYYHPAADLNHDGLISPIEQFVIFKEMNNETLDWINSYTAPRRARLGITIRY